LQIVPAGECRVGYETRIETNDPYFTEISKGWSDALKQAFKSLPPYVLPD